MIRATRDLGGRGWEKGSNKSVCGSAGAAALHGVPQIVSAPNTASPCLFVPASISYS